MITAHPGDFLETVLKALKVKLFGKWFGVTIFARRFLKSLIEIPPGVSSRNRTDDGHHVHFVLDCLSGRGIKTEQETITALS